MVKHNQAYIFPQSKGNGLFMVKIFMYNMLLKKQILQNIYTKHRKTLFIAKYFLLIYNRC